MVLEGLLGGEQRLVLFVSEDGQQFPLVDVLPEQAELLVLVDHI